MELIPKIFIILLLILGFVFPSTANGVPYVAIRYDKSYNYYLIWLPTKVDGKFLWMML
jgi:hypothetical protein